MHLRRTEMISRQGKATIHMHPTVFSSPRRPRQKSLELEETRNVPKLLKELEMKRVEEEKNAKSKPIRPSSAFTAVSRQTREQALRNRTDSPHACKYTPNYDLFRKRRDHALRINNPRTSPRPKKLHLPFCQQPKLKCNRRRRNTSAPSQRFEMTFDEFDTKLGAIQSQWTQIAEKPQKHQGPAVEFEKMVERLPLNAEASLHEGRFSFAGCDSELFSKNSRAKSFDFGKKSARSELFPEKHQVDFYNSDIQKELNMPKLTCTILPYQKMRGRKPLLHTQQLQTPNTCWMDSLEKAEKMISKTISNIPRFDSTMPRDDSMYRITETYMLNVPSRLLATEVPFYLEEDSVLKQTLKERFSSTLLSVTTE